MDELFDTYVLNRSLEQLPIPVSPLLNMFFSEVQTSTSENILFDIDLSKPTITPFVSPLVRGKPRKEEGYLVKSFKPAYAKDLARFDPQAPVRRRQGERLGGSLTPMERRRAQISAMQKKQVDALTRREAVMAVEALRTGKVTVSGEDYPTVVVDFQRDPTLTVALSGGARWGETGVSPSENIEDWVNRVVLLGGGNPDQVIMDPKAWGLLRKEEAFLKTLDNRRATTSTIEAGSLIRREDRIRYVGNNSDIDYWVYNGRYIDVDGTTKQYLPDYTVLIGDPAQIEGVRAYGMIHDEKANYEAMRYFQKSWLEEDPAVRWMLLQAAPLVFPYRPNASFCATVR